MNGADLAGGGHKSLIGCAVEKSLPVPELNFVQVRDKFFYIPVFALAGLIDHLPEIGEIQNALVEGIDGGLLSIYQVGFQCPQARGVRRLKSGKSNNIDCHLGFVSRESAAEVPRLK